MAVMEDEGLSGDDLDSLLDEATDAARPPSKKNALPVKRSAAAAAAAAKRAEAQREADELRAAQDAAKARAAQLAQIVNLHIAGFSLAEIGASIGASPEEVDRLLASETQRYVRSQPALRTYVRNWISSKYTAMLEADWDDATNKASPVKLENQDRVMRMLDKMGRLHGADAPIQSEVKIESAPEAVEKLVAAISAAQGMGYDDAIFDSDIVDGDVIEDAVEQSAAALEVSGNAVEESDGHDSL